MSTTPSSACARRWPRPGSAPTSCPPPGQSPLAGTAGGDQGRDLETFKSYLEKSDISDSAFLGLVSEGVLVFAFSTEKNPTKSKIRSDIEKIMASGETPERIYFFSTDDIPVGRRHSFQQDIWQDHAVRLEIFDKHWLAEHLSAPDLYWAAEKYLNTPSGLYLTPSGRRSLLPPPPDLVLGRDDDLQDIKQALGVGLEEASASGNNLRRVVAVHG